MGNEEKQNNNDYCRFDCLKEKMEVNNEIKNLKENIKQLNELKILTTELNTLLMKTTHQLQTSIKDSEKNELIVKEVKDKIEVIESNITVLNTEKKVVIATVTILMVPLYAFIIWMGTTLIKHSEELSKLIK